MAIVFSLAPTACVFGIPDYFKEIKINCSACLENNETKLKGKESCLFSIALLLIVQAAAMVAYTMPWSSFSWCYEI